MNRLEQRVRRVFAEHVALREGALTLEAPVPEDVRTFVAIVAQLEREFDVSLSDDGMAGISTVGDLGKVPRIRCGGEIVVSHFCANEEFRERYARARGSCSNR